MNGDYIYTIYQTANALRASDKTVRRYIEAGQLESHLKDPPNGKGGGQWRYVSARSIADLAVTKGISLDLEYLQRETNDRGFFDRTFMPHQERSAPEEWAEVSDTPRTSRIESETRTEAVLREQLEKAEARVEKLEEERNSKEVQLQQEIRASSTKHALLQNNLRDLLEATKVQTLTSNERLHWARQGKLSVTDIQDLPLIEIGSDGKISVRDHESVSRDQGSIFDTEVVDPNPESTKDELRIEEEPQDVVPTSPPPSILVEEESKTKSKSKTKKKRRIAKKSKKKPTPKNQSKKNPVSKKASKKSTPKRAKMKEPKKRGFLSRLFSK